jgi:FkbH-like protein
MSQDKTAEYELALPPQLTQSLRRFAREEHLTASCLFQAAWGLLLASVDGRGDVVFGTVVSGRPAELDGVETIVGPLINTLPLRVRPDRALDAGTWLRSLQAELLAHEQHSQLPLSRIRQMSEIRAGDPLFASLFVVQNFITDAQRKEIASDRQRIGIEVTAAPTSYKISYPLTAFVTLGELQSIRFCYDAAQFDAVAIAALGVRLQHILEQMAAGVLEWRADAAAAPGCDAPKPELRFHHMGVACEDIARGIEFVRQQFQVESIGEPIHDPLQDAQLCLIQTRNGVSIELVAGPQVAGLLARGVTLYHTCFEVDELDQAIADAQSRGAALVSPAKPAVLFGGRRVAFLQTPVGLLELLETSLRPEGGPTALPLAPNRRLVVAATFTAEPMREALERFSEWSGLQARVEFAPYAQVFQQLVDPASAIRANRDGANLLLVRLEDWFGVGPGLRSAEGAVERNVAQFIQALAAAARGSDVPYLVAIAPDSPRLLADPALAGTSAEFEQRLVTLAAELPAVHIVSGREALASFAMTSWFDGESERIAHVPYTPDAYTALAVASVRRWHGLTRAPIKVIVVDCDQTLWGGVCAELGPQGIALSPARLALQDFLVRQYEAGVLICLCSRNIEGDVLAVFDQRQDMRLTREHLVAWRINWRAKSDNIRELATELGLGLDAIAFIDDDAVQCAEVRSACPAVLTLQLPGEDDAIMPFLRQVWAFDLPEATEDARQRTRLYRDNRAREAASAEAPSLAAFIASLDISIGFAPIGAAERTRVAELTVRTNQFNLNGRRRTAAELDRLLDSGEIAGCCVRLADRFGDYGLVGVMLYARSGERLAIDTFLLSCRALGRGVEHAMVRELGRIAGELGCTALELPLVTTDRNAPVAEFLEQAFGQCAEAGAAGIVYRPATASATDLHWNCDERAAVGGQPMAASRNDIATVAQARAPYEAMALALSDLAGVTAGLRLAALPAARNLRPYEPPREPVEERLCALFGELLGISRVGIKDHFFELGGHSLMATRLVAACQKEYGIDLPLARIFDAPTVEAFASTIQALVWVRISAASADAEADVAMDEGAL